MIVGEKLRIVGVKAVYPYTRSQMQQSQAMLVSFRSALTISDHCKWALYVRTDDTVRDRANTTEAL